MGKGCLPPGFRFHPTDVELVKYYLKRKVMGRKLHLEAITELDIYKYAPWDLPDKSVLSFGDLKWYFFCPVEKKYARGARKSRATEVGYWKTTGRDRPVHYVQDVVGMIKTLVFHQGKAPKGDRTDWVMHEYRIEDKNLDEKGVVQDAYVLCVVFKKDGPGPRNGAQYGAPFKEEDWSDDEVEDGPGAVSSVALCAPNLALSSNTNLVGSVATDSTAPEITCIVPSVEPIPEDDLLPYYDTLPGICLNEVSPPVYEMSDAPIFMGGSSTVGKGDDISSMMDIFTEESSLWWNNEEQRFEVSNSDAVFSAALPSEPSSLENVSWSNILAGTSGGCITPGQSTEACALRTLPAASERTSTAFPTLAPGQLTEADASSTLSAASEKTAAVCPSFLEVSVDSDDDNITHMLATFSDDPIALYP